jgi:hypothetical protein
MDGSLVRCSFLIAADPGEIKEASAGNRGLFAPGGALFKLFCLSDPIVSDARAGAIAQLPHPRMGNLSPRRLHPLAYSIRWGG